MPDLVPVCAVLLWLSFGVVTFKIVNQRHRVKRANDFLYNTVTSTFGCIIQDSLVIPAGPVGLLLALFTDFFDV